MANEDVLVYGSPTTAISMAGTLADGANTYASNSTISEVTNSSNYPYARAVLDITDTFAAAPTAGRGVELWMIKLNIDGTSDMIPEPSGTSDLGVAIPVGFFPIAALDQAQRVAIVISLEDVPAAKFYIKNSCGQTISYTSTATTVKITPFSHGPAA